MWMAVVLIEAWLMGLQKKCTIFQGSGDWDIIRIQLPKNAAFPSSCELLWIIKFTSSRPLFLSLGTGVLFLISKCITLMVLHLLFLLTNGLNVRERKQEMNVKWRDLSLFNPLSMFSLILTLLASLAFFSPAVSRRSCTLMSGNVFCQVGNGHSVGATGGSKKTIVLEAKGSDI